MEIVINTREREREGGDQIKIIKSRAERRERKVRVKYKERRSFTSVIGPNFGHLYVNPHLLRILQFY